MAIENGPFDRCGKLETAAETVISLGNWGGTLLLCKTNNDPLWVQNLLYGWLVIYPSEVLPRVCCRVNKVNSLLVFLFFLFFYGLIGYQRDNLKAATTLGVLDNDKKFDIRLIDQARLIQNSYLAPRPREIKENELIIDPWSSMRFLLVCFYYSVEAKYDFFVTWN